MSETETPWTEKHELMRTEVLVNAMGGEGEVLEALHPGAIREAWLEFSGDFAATDLVVSMGTVGNFAAYLVRKLAEVRAERDTLRGLCAEYRTVCDMLLQGVVADGEIAAIEKRHPELFAVPEVPG